MDFGNGGFGHVKPFAVHFVFGNIVHAHGLERACADMQRNLRKFYTFLLQCAQDFVGEMQPCGGCRHSPLIFGIHGLVARVVVVVGGAHDVGRQRQRAVFFQQRINIVPVVELQLEQFADALGHGGVQAAFKYQLGAGFGRFGRADMRQRGVFVQYAFD